MNYEEFVSCHPRLINWDNDWDFIFKYTKPLFDKYNKDWFYMWISNNGSMDELCNVWDKLVANWKLIQKYLGHAYKVCPWCGAIRLRKFSNHLEYHHKLTLTDWILKLNNLSSIPKCANPECNNLVTPDYSRWIMHETCCMSCQAKLKVYRGTSPVAYSTDEEHNKLVYENIIKSIKSRDSSGNNPLAYPNRPRDPITGKDLIAINSARSAINNGNFNMQAKNLPRDNTGKVLYNRSGWKSKAELKLKDILDNLNINYESQKYVWIEDKYYYKIDFYLPELNLGLEEDGDFKWTEDYIPKLKDPWLSRKLDIESNTDIKILNIKESDVWNIYSYYPNKLIELINSQVTNVNK